MSNIFVQQCTVKTLRKDISNLQKSRRWARFQAAHGNAANMVSRTAANLVFISFAKSLPQF